MNNNGAPSNAERFGESPGAATGPSPSADLGPSPSADPGPSPSADPGPSPSASGQCVSLLLGGESVNANGRRGMTRLHRAASKGDAALVSLLLQKGADANAYGPWGDSPLHAAARGDASGRCVMLLIGGGAKVNARNCYGYTLLHCAAAWGTEAAVLALLAGGARRDAEDNYAERPFEMTSRPDLKDLLRL